MTISKQTLRRALVRRFQKLSPTQAVQQKPTHPLGLRATTSTLFLCGGFGGSFFVNGWERQTKSRNGKRNYQQRPSNDLQHVAKKTGCDPAANASNCEKSAKDKTLAFFVWCFHGTNFQTRILCRFGVLVTDETQPRRFRHSETRSSVRRSCFESSNWMMSVRIWRTV